MRLLLSKHCLKHAVNILIQNHYNGPEEAVFYMSYIYVYTVF